MATDRRHPPDDPGAATTVGPGLRSLRARLAALTAEAAQVRRAIAIAEHRPDPAKPIGRRLVDLLSAHRATAFSPAELADGVHAPIESVRKALVRLVCKGVVDHGHHASYQLARWEGSAPAP